MLYAEFPDAKVIKMPTDSICVETHIWGGHPLHFADSYYYYLAECIDNITGVRTTGTLEKLWKRQCLENKITLNNIEMSMMHDMYKRNRTNRYPIQ